MCMMGGLILIKRSSSSATDFCLQLGVRENPSPGEVPLEETLMLHSIK